jgi:Aldo/keto reductase family
VSNFTVRQMEDLFQIPQGDRCATNQVLYNLGDRSIERDLLPWCEQHNMPVMAYSPLGGLGASLLGDPMLGRIAAAHACSAAAVALAWTIRSGNVIAIPESGSVAHVRENAVALSLALATAGANARRAAGVPSEAVELRFGIAAHRFAAALTWLHGVSAKEQDDDTCSRLKSDGGGYKPPLPELLESPCPTHCSGLLCPLLCVANDRCHND